MSKTSLSWYRNLLHYTLEVETCPNTFCYPSVDASKCINVIFTVHNALLKGSFPCETIDSDHYSLPSMAFPCSLIEAPENCCK